jgi:arylsulfatase A-like enzyme/GT2 family glycosyltransferase
VATEHDKRLTILICTHNRAALLARALASLQAAQRPPGWQVDILVVANACSDGTHSILERYTVSGNADDRLPVTWFAEPRPGQSHALNSAVARLKGGWIALVDDDHRVAGDFLEQVALAISSNPEPTMLCGRILPDWDGSEPPWVHNTGPYRIYPLPVPRQDFGEAQREIGIDGPVPGGGNLILRCEVFKRIGDFATELGPQGHNLGGGEDTDFMLRALRAGERLTYVPQIVQYHFVDAARLTTWYLMRKAFHRSRASAQLSQSSGDGVPLYAWRKLIEYFLMALFSFSWTRVRFYLVRTAASLGEIKAMRECHARFPLGKPMARCTPRWAIGLALAGTALALAGVLFSGNLQAFRLGVLAPALLAGIVSTALLLGSLLTFSRTGPNLRAEILSHYRLYTVFALLRLTFWAWLLLTLMGGVGVLVYSAAVVLGHFTSSFGGCLVAAGIAMAVMLALQFCRHLLLLPASICASLNILPSRLYVLWRLLTPRRLAIATYLLIIVTAATVGLAGLQLATALRFAEVLALWGIAAAYIGLVLWAIWEREPDSAGIPDRDGPPNILMVGSDTLRADRLGGFGYRRALTPRVDELGRRGTTFTQCFVPCARTAPSLLSLLTGTWPHRHGIRDNFVADDETRLPVEALPAILRRRGYATAAVSDWCGGDLKKFKLGFEFLDLPNDQWNIKYFIRQGPKNLRLILSLFTHNRFGKMFLPELYYLAGIPLTRDVGLRGRQVLAALGRTGKPFFLNLFFSSTHPPFGSEYPHYTLFSDPCYRGESKFVMARLTDPLEIIRRQGQPKEEFDLDQILDLYDGCVKSFDDEVGRTLDFLAKSGLERNTIIVIYSDHGMEFFEHETWGQGNSAISDFSPKVPLIIAGPGCVSGQRVDAIVRSIDIMPTLLEHAGIAPPPQIDGVSLQSVLQGGPVPDLAAFNETGIWIADVPGMPATHLKYPNLLDLLEIPNRESGTLAIKQEYQEIVVRAKDRMIRQGQWKLVYQPLADGPLLRLYNVHADPGCVHDVADAEPEVTARLWVALQTWMGAAGSAAPHHPRHRSDTRDSAPGPTPQAPA